MLVGGEGVPVAQVREILTRLHCVTEVSSGRSSVAALLSRRITLSGEPRRFLRFFKTGSGGR